MPQVSFDWLYGSLDLLILRTLAAGSSHGFGVASWLRDRTGGALELEDAALYKALHRLERQGLIESEWAVTENKRSAKYYQLSAAGRKALRERREAWRKWVRMVDTVLAPA